MTDAPDLPDEPACRRHNPELWQTEPHSHMNGIDRRFAERATDTAKRICFYECPVLVRLACLRHALEHREPTGVWGGMDTAQREALISRALSSEVA